MILFWIINGIKALNRENSDLQFSIGVSFGMLLGFIPVNTLHWVLILCTVLIFRINLAATLFSGLFFLGLGTVCEPTFNRIGLWILTTRKSLIPLWAWAYHAPLFPFTGFNHSQVMGATVTGFTLFFPLLFITRSFVHRNRENLHTYWLSSRIQRSYAHYHRFTS